MARVAQRGRASSQTGSKRSSGMSSTAVGYVEKNCLQLAMWAAVNVLGSFLMMLLIVFSASTGQKRT